MTITAHKAMSRKIEGGSRRCGWLLNFLVIMLLCAGLTVTNTISARAANLGDNLPVSIIDGTSPPQLQGEDQQNPTVIALPDKNKWLVVWEDWRNWTSTGADIYGRFIGSDGSSYCGNEFIICGQPGDQTVPTLAYRPGSTVLVAWQDTRGTAGGGFVYYKTIDVSLLDATGSGFALGGEKALSYKSIGGDGLLSRKLPKAAYDTTRDQFWLVWVESRDQLQRVVEDPFDGFYYPKWRFGDSNYISFTTIAGGDGNAKVPEIIRNTGGSSSSTVRKLSSESEFTETGGTVTYIYEYFTNVNNVTVACDDSSPETLIAWEGIRGKATLICKWEEKDEEEICTGEGEDEVCYSNGNYGRPTAGDHYSSELTTEHDSGGSADGIVHIYSIFDKYITQQVVHSQLVDASETAGYYPALGYDSIHRKFLVAWEARQDNGFSKIYGQLLFSGGGHYGTNLRLSSQDMDDNGIQDDNISTTNQTRPNIAVDTTNQRFLVTWQDGRNSQLSLENLDIYGQFIDCEGSPRGNNFIINQAKGNQYNPQTAYNRGNHQFLTVWKDARNINDSYADIYGQRYDLGQPQLMLLGSDNTQLSPPLLIFDNLESGNSATLSIKLLNTGDSTIKIDYVSELSAPYSYKNLAPELAYKDGMTLNLVPNSSLNLCIEFSPTEGGTFLDRFSIYSDAGDLSVNLQGSSDLTSFGIEVTPQILDFDMVGVGNSLTKNFIITNTGTTDMTVSAVDPLPTAFSQTLLATGTSITTGQSLTIPITFTPFQAAEFSGTLRFLCDNSLTATKITLIGRGSNATISPTNLDFPVTPVNSTTTNIITIHNISTNNMVVKSIRFSGDAENTFRIKEGIAEGDEIPIGGSKTFSVQFIPAYMGEFSDTLSLSCSSQTEETYTINLSGIATGQYILREIDSFTADLNYHLQVGAFSQQTGKLYVLMIHDPLSAGTIYALTPDGNLVPFPYTSPNAWQNLYFSPDSSPSMTVDLNTINLQQLGCHNCPDPSTIITPGGDDFMFGTIDITTPAETTPYSCTDDFKYMAGNLYVATYVADDTAGMPFDFNHGLIELLWLKIHSLNGSWRVTSEYYGHGREHADLLHVQEEDGTISATWSPKYSNLVISYAPDESAYLITFNVGSYNYVYKITTLDADRFSGTYTCTANGEIVAQDQPVCGVRAGSGLVCTLPSNTADTADDVTPGADDGNVTPGAGGDGSQNSTNSELSIKDQSMRLIESEYGYSDYAWQVTINNSTDSPMKVDVTFQLLDGSGFTLDENMETTTINPGSQVVRGTGMCTDDLFNQVESTLAKVKKK